MIKLKFFVDSLSKAASSNYFYSCSCELFCFIVRRFFYWFYWSIKIQDYNELNWLQNLMFFSYFWFFQDCHIKTHSPSGEPVPDTSQDYVLLASSENATHTVVRFRRKLNTCDEKFDVPITVRVNNSVTHNLIRNYTKSASLERHLKDKGNAINNVWISTWTLIKLLLHTNTCALLPQTFSSRLFFLRRPLVRFKIINISCIWRTNSCISLYTNNLPLYPPFSLLLF
jgi:DOMON domain